MSLSVAERPRNAHEVARFCGGREMQRPVPSRSPAANRPGKEQFSVGWRDLLARSGRDAVTGLGGLGPHGARRGEAGQRVVPGSKMPDHSFNHPRVIGHRHDTHRAFERVVKGSVPEFRNMATPFISATVASCFPVLSLSMLWAGWWACGAGRFATVAQSPLGSGRRLG